MRKIIDELMKIHRLPQELPGNYKILKEINLKFIDTLFVKTKFMTVVWWITSILIMLVSIFYFIVSGLIAGNTFALVVYPLILLIFILVFFAQSYIYKVTDRGIVIINKFLKKTNTSFYPWSSFECFYVSKGSIFLKMKSSVAGRIVGPGAYGVTKDMAVKIKVGNEVDSYKSIISKFLKEMA